MSDVLADLYVLLRAESSRMVSGFAEGGAAGEEMAASIVAASAQVDAAAAAMDAAVASVGEAAGAASAEVAGGFTEAGLSGEQLAAKIAAISADVEAEIASLDSSLISIGTAADEAAVVNAAAMEKMRADTIAAITAMETAEAEAVASTEAMAAKIDAAAASSTATTAGKLNALKTAGVAVGVAAALVAAGSVKMAADFESSTNRLVTSAGETQSNLDGVRQGILAMASQVGYSSDDLANAMYKIESGGQHGAAGLDVLKASAQGAKAENADLTVVADAVTSVLQDYHLQASASADVTSKLVAATASGKMTFEELSGSLSSVLPVASANHVALEDILGDISSMTVHGMSAQQVTQNLSDTIRHMAAPTQQQSKELAALGMNSQQLSTDLGQNGLYGVIQNISQAIVSRFSPDMQHVVISLKDALSKSTPAVQDLGQKLLDGSMSAAAYAKEAKGLDVVSAGQAQSFATLVKSMNQLGTAQNGGSTAWQSYTAALRGAMGDATGLNVALMLTGENSKTTADAISSVRNATADADGNVRGWSEIQGTFNQKMSEAKDGLGALAISIGTYLLPAVSAVAGAIASATQWMSQHKAVAEVLAIAVGVGLVIAFSALLAVFWGFAANPVTWIIAAIIVIIGLLALAVYEVISHWSDIVGFFAGIWSAVASAFMAAVSFIGGLLSGAWNGIVSGLTAAWNFIAGIWNAVGAFFAGVWNGILSGVTNAWNAVWGAITSVVNAITGFIVRGFTAVVNATRPIWQPIVTIISDIFQIIWTIVSTIVTIIGLFLFAAWRGIVAGATTVWNAVSGAISAAWNAISNVVMGAVNAVSTALSAAWNAIWGVISAVWNAIVGFLTQVWTGIVAGATSAWNAVWGAISGPINFIWGLISSVWNEIVGFLGTAWNNISSTVGNGISNVLNSIGGLAGKIWDTISGIGHWLWDAGVNLIEGLLNGIASMTGRLLDKVRQMAADAVNTVKSWLGISSPSKVFQAEIGVHIPTGVAAGIDAAAADANASARRMALGVLAASKDILGQGAEVPVTAAFAGGAASASAYSVGSNRGTGQSSTQIVIYLTVQGSVHSDQDLIKAIQDGLLQVGVRNNGNFTNYTGFGGG